MAAYDDLVKAHQEHEKTLRAYEQRCLAFFQSLHETVSKALGWPGHAFHHVNLHGTSGFVVPPGARPAPSGYLDHEGYHSALLVKLENIAVTFPVVVADMGPHFVVRVGRFEAKAPQGDRVALEPLAKHIYEAIREESNKHTLMALVEAKPQEKPQEKPRDTKQPSTVS